MLSVGDKRRLENGGCTLATFPLRNKRPKVSAVRQFPSQCGSFPVQISMQKNEVEDSGERVVESREDVESTGEQGGDCYSKGKGFFEKIVVSQSYDFPVSPNISEKATISLEKSKHVEHGSEESPKLSVGQGSNGLSKELIIEKPKSSQDLQKMEVEESMTKHETHGTSQELLEVSVGSPIALTNTVVPGLKETSNDQIEVVVEGTSMQLYVMPYHPIPSAFAWKERKYPSCRRVSAARDFPPGCGHNVQQLNEAVDKRFGLGKTDSNAHKEVASLNQVGNSLEADNSSRTAMKWVGCKKTGDKIEGRPESDKNACAKVIMQESQFVNLVETEGQKEICKVEGEERERSMVKETCNCEDEDREVSSNGVDGEIKVYCEDEHKKKKSSCVPFSDIEQEGKSIAGVQNERSTVLVLGLMTAPNCPWRRGKEAVKSCSSVSSVKQSKRKKHGDANQDQDKCLPSKSTDNVENLEERSNMIVPYLKETEPIEVSGISNDGDSSENEDLSNDFLLIPERRIDVNLLPSNATGSSGERGVCSNAREILRLFQTIVRKLLQGEETKNKDGKSKDPENASKRIDLLAAKILKASGKCVSTGKKGILGPIPGVEVGDFFQYRMELSIIGLHRPPQGGIDYVKQGGKIIAISVVASGGYANDVDSSDVLIYTGQGGNPKYGDKQPENQKLERGNLALKNSVDEKNVVRVIRGFKETKPSDAADGKPKTIATYTYDGLYTVEKYWPDVGPCKKLVYKFELRRIPGQPELAWKEVKRSKKFKVREGLCVADISEGKETFPICAVNTIDDEKPPAFMYITSMIYPDWCQPIPPRGCDCKNGCSDSEHCACAVQNGGEIPYNYDGAIVEAKPLVYECGPLCKCPPTCHNRVSQRGIRIPLEIFKTESRGWGVRSLSSIPSGSFICEYIGELLDDREAEQRTGSDEYLFDIGQNFNNPTLWDGLPSHVPDVASASDDIVENIGFTIDAANYGNVGRFINHSCSPNLYAQNVLYDHDDKRIPHVMLFAMENIPPLQELSYDYNYTIDQVFDSDGNIRKKSCCCGSSECTGRMY